MKGEFQESTPFRFSESQPVVDYFGQQLLKAGYAYYGSEPMYSGIAGTEVSAETTHHTKECGRSACAVLCACVVHFAFKIYVPLCVHFQ
jgi:hypothetical protein